VRNYAKTPSPQQILNYWAKGAGRQKLDGLGIEFDFEKRCCFACGDDYRIERAHIVPWHVSKSNDPSNLHLLCHICHKISEGLAENVYWEWLKNTNWNKYKFPILHRFNEMQEAGFCSKKFESLLAEHIDRAIEYFGSYTRAFKYMSDDLKKECFDHLRKVIGSK
jgi:hypothetical protein